MSMIAAALASAVALSAQPQSSPAAPAPETAAAAAPEAAAPAPPTAADKLKEAADLVEVKANTKGNLQKAIEIYEAALKDGGLSQKEQVDAWIDVSRAYLRVGDLEKKADLRVAWYEKGRAAAQKAQALDPKSAEAVAWDAFNMASIGSARGVMNSLFMVPDLKKALERTLQLDPNHHYARVTLARVYHEVPGMFGGSDKKALELFLEALKRDPAFTPAMYELAKFYKDTGEEESAKEWARKVVDAKRSSLPNDWRKFDVPNAKKLLEELEGK